MADELGPIVIDPHAFRRLIPALAVWLFLFLTAGDGVSMLKRQRALWGGKPLEAEIAGKRKTTVNLIVGRERRYFLELAYRVDGEPRERVEAVSAAGWAQARSGSRVPAHAWKGEAWLDDDYGYSRWKLGLFGAAFAGLWLWAAATYRFG